MPAVFPAEAENMVAKLLFKGVDANRGVGLKLGLFTNSSFPVADNLVNLSHITEVAVGATNLGYAPKTLVASDWTVVDSVASALTQSFTATGTWADTVQGYFVATTGTIPKLLFYHVDTSYVFTTGTVYDVTLNVSVS